MTYLSAISLTASILYFTVGFHALIINRKSELCRIFFYMTISMSIWSFGSCFLYLARNIYEFSFWNKFSAFGWCTFEALTLYFVMVLTRYKKASKWYVRLLIMLPSLFFLSMALFLFGPDKNPGSMVQTIFYVGDFLYNYTYLILSIIIIFFWGHRSQSRIHKKQAQIIVVCSIIPILLHFTCQTILPAFHIINLPNMGQIFTLIMLLGVNYSIIRYQFMSVPNSIIINELFNELTGLTLLTDPQGIIMKVNTQVCRLLEYSPDEIIGSHINSIIKQEDINRVMENCDEIHKRLSFADIKLNSKSGKIIPFDISIIPLNTLHTKTNLLRGILLIGEDIRSTKQLEDEIVKHKKTNKRLQNSERMLRKILEITTVAIVLISKTTSRVIYLNKKAEELFGLTEAELIGSDFSEYFLNQEQKTVLVNAFEENKAINNSEVQFRRKDGSKFIGLISVTHSVYHDEEVALSCVIDMTEQKRTEETLKKNNEYINELNKKLMLMNNDLVNKSIRDGLTQLYNHQYMNEVLEDKLRGISDDKTKLSLMMLDIDHFKQINDKFGHQSGDGALVKIADLLIQNTRMNDYIGRYGGEEFIVILPDTGIEEACKIAENIRHSVDNYDFGLANYKISVSTGVAQYEGERSNDLINRADMLLYQAKANGRNRVER